MCYSLKMLWLRCRRYFVQVCRSSPTGRLVTPMPYTDCRSCRGEAGTHILLPNPNSAKARSFMPWPIANPLMITSAHAMLVRSIMPKTLPVQSAAARAAAKVAAAATVARAAAAVVAVVAAKAAATDIDAAVPTSSFMPSAARLLCAQQGCARMHATLPLKCTPCGPHVMSTMQCRGDVKLPATCAQSSCAGGHARQPPVRCPESFGPKVDALSGTPCVSAAVDCHSASSHT